MLDLEGSIGVRERHRVLRRRWQGSSGVLGLALLSLFFNRRECKWRRVERWHTNRQEEPRSTTGKEKGRERSVGVRGRKTIRKLFPPSRVSKISCGCSFCRGSIRCDLLGRTGAAAQVRDTLPRPLTQKKSGARTDRQHDLQSRHDSDKMLKNQHKDTRYEQPEQQETTSPFQAQRLSPHPPHIEGAVGFGLRVWPPTRTKLHAPPEGDI